MTSSTWNGRSFASDAPKRITIDVAKSIAANIDTLEPLERMIAMMEQRRNAAYHQAEQHRANLGNRLRQAGRTSRGR
jgi:hypothetical protein